jgi:hypothetical protein
MWTKRVIAACLATGSAWCRRSNQNQPGMVELKPATFLFKMIGDILARSDFPFLA